MAMRDRLGWVGLRVLPLIWLSGLGTAQAQEFPGGELQSRPALISERGSHPTVIVQTVPQATTTATALVMRYAEPLKQGDSSSAAHLLEHLLFRTRPNDTPGALLLRNESLGNSSKAWLDGDTIVFSEEVPAEKGLDSLQLQLDRLSGVPRDAEGWKLEKDAIAGEIQSAESPENEARWLILGALGYPTRPAGGAEQLRATRGEDLTALLEHLNLNSDVVIAVVGPQTAREVRQQLSAGLKPLAPKRSQERAALKLAPLDNERREIPSPTGISQSSTFFESDEEDSRVVALANTLALNALPSSVKARVSREAGGLFRLDVSPADSSIESCFGALAPEAAERIYRSHEIAWLERLESRQERAESLALSTLYQRPPESRVSREEYPLLLERARDLLREGKSGSVSLTLRPPVGSTPEARLYDFSTVARKENLPPAQTEKLPNQLTVNLQPWDAWPTLAVAGFFRISPYLSYTQRARLERFLKSRQGGILEYDVQQGAVFFQAQRPSEEAEGLLRDSALELRALAQEESVLDSSSDIEPDLIESFFMPGARQADQARIAGSRIFAPQNAHLVVVGQYDAQALERGLRPSWSGWFGKNSPPGVSAAAPKTAPEAAPEAGKILDIPKGQDPILLIGLQGPSRSSPDFMAFNLVLQTLAGRPYSSLVSREFHGGPEAVDSVRLIPLESTVREDSQVWVLALRLKQTLEKPDAVLEKLRQVLNTLGSAPLPAAELERTRDYLKSSLTLSAASNLGRARVLAHAEYYRLSHSYTEDFAGLYDNLTPELVRASCARLLSDQTPRWLYLRPTKE